MPEEMTPFPLDWPHGVPRTNKPQKSSFRITPDKAQESLYNELRLLGARRVVVSCNSPLRRDGKAMAIPRDGRQPHDAGVAVYFLLGGKPKYQCCDYWASVCDNMQAIALTIQAKRAIERYKASTLDEMLPDVPLLPAPGETVEDNGAAIPEQWWRVLEVLPSAPLEVAEASYRKLSKMANGDQAKQLRLNLSIEEARKGALV